MENTEASIMICGLPYRIIYRDRNSRSDMSMGRCDSKELTIHIDKEMPEEQRKATLCHEWIHAVLDANGVEHPESVAAVLGTELYRSGFEPWKKPDNGLN
jgi:Zn-dependent peptidase ImmA (M78 family)